MGISDRLKNWSKKAEDAAAEHKGEIEKAVTKAEELADQRTQGKYHDQIQKAGAKADQYVEGLQPPEPPKVAPPQD